VVEIFRPNIEDSVEQRIQRLQDRKQGLADAGLGEGSGQSESRLDLHIRHLN
jgi:SNF2 family DNA or RNA helicase